MEKLAEILLSLESGYDSWLADILIIQNLLRNEIWVEVLLNLNLL